MTRFDQTMTEVQDTQTSVLLTTFTNKKKRYKVFFHQNKIIWDREKPPYAQHSVPVENLIAVAHIEQEPSHPLDDPIIDPNNFVIHYAKPCSDNTLKYCNIIFNHADPMQVSSWVKTLQNHLQGLTNRPKNILVFVNPYGGKRNAMKIYEKIAKPLFQIAGVDVTLNVSQRKDQIKDFVTYHNLDLYDAVGCVGGDGTLSELFNGLVTRECRLMNLDMDDINVELPKPTKPIGIIPAGSTDTIAYCIYGTVDVPTAVLTIILGSRLGLDLVSVYDENKLLRLYASVLSYGYLGDIAHASDKYRWMGPRRYEFTGFSKILANRYYEGEIAMLSEKENVMEKKCVENCDSCEVVKLGAKTNGLEWKTLSGKYFMISGANISCACKRSPNGIAPFSHLGDGKVHIVLVRHTSLLNILKLLITLSGTGRNLRDLDFVEMYQAREFCFRAINRKSHWNCDGEVQNQTDIRAKVRCQLLTVFGKGPPEPTTPQLQNSCCWLC